MLDGMFIRKKCEMDTHAGKLIGYVDFGNSPGPQETDEAELATDALVLMAVGLTSPWKMPIGYFLNHGVSKDVLSNLILEAIRALDECTLQVVAVICDGLGANVATGKVCK